VSDFDRDILRRCYQFASRESHDPRTQNAAALVDGDYPFIFWANRIPSRVPLTASRVERKASFIEHAERGAIYRCAGSVRGSTMYCPWAACADCARAIIAAGVLELVTHAAPFHDRPEWEGSIRDAAEMLAEAGVKVRSVEGEIGDCSILFDGKVVYP
jgi:tRNA(Arg) A34 adenosine deaminase TadA